MRAKESFEERSSLVKSWPSTIRQIKIGSKTQRLSIPKQLVKDPEYPFKPGQVVYVKIIDGGLRVEKANGDE